MKTMCLTTCSNIFFNMFRTTQNGSKLIQRVKKAKNAPIFSKQAEEILTLFDLTHLCTNFVLVHCVMAILECMDNTVSVFSPPEEQV